MKKSIKTEGMMCQNCERHVKSALEAIEGVSVESISHETNEVVVNIPDGVSDEALKDAIVEEGYKVLSIS